MKPKPVAIDHLVFTVHDVDRTVAWYRGVLGMEVLSRGGRTALAFGSHRLNLQPAGCAEKDLLRRLRERRVSIEEGPVERTGSTGPISSVYVRDRDPDGNLVEVAVRMPSGR